MKFLDERITTIVDQIIAQDEEKNRPIMKSYLETEYNILGHRTSVIEVLVKNNCTSFITSGIFANMVKKTWKGTKTERLEIIKSCFWWILYILLLLCINFIGCILLVADRFEKIGKYFRRGQDKSQLECLAVINKLHRYHDKYKFKKIPPLVSFIMDGIIKLAFITSMGYFVIRSMHFSISNIEIFLYFYIIGLIMEELHQITERRCDYMKDAWNIIDGTAIACMIIGFCIKFASSYGPLYKEQRNCSYVNVNQYANMLRDCTSILEANDKALFMARFFLCCGLIASFVKITQMTLYFKSIGPVQSMITNMIFRDLVPFLIIFTIYILAFGISFSALTYPNSYTETVNITKFDLFSARKVFIFGFYGLAGQYPILDLVENQANSENDEIKNHGKPHPWSRGSIAYFLLPLYILIINILLLNLLIARFSSTVQRIQEKSKFYLNKSVYNLLKDYETRFILPPPLNILSMVLDLIMLLCRKLENENRDCLDKKDIEAFRWHMLYCKLQYDTLKKKKISKFPTVKTSETEEDVGEMVDGKKNEKTIYGIMQEQAKRMDEMVKKNEENISEVAQEQAKRIDEMVNSVKKNEENIYRVMQLLEDMSSSQNTEL